MLESRYRFHSRGGVRHTYKKGKVLRSPSISLIYAQNERGFLRFSVVVSKKVIKSAVGRNRIRRRVYEAIRLILREHPIKSGDFVFVIYSTNVRTLPFSELSQELRRLLLRSSRHFDS